MSELAARAWLARRVVVRRPADWGLTVVTGVAVLCLTLLALATAAAPHVVSRQSERAAAVSPHVDRNTAADDPAKLRMLEPEVANSRRWEGHRIVRDFYVRGASSLTAPGIPAMPGPDEFYASPHLAALIEHDHTVAALFSRLRKVGTIRPSGLTQPHELRAIAGILPTRSLLVDVQRFGGQQSLNPAEEQQDNRRLNAVVAFFVAAMVWIPGVTLTVIVSRLAAAQRRGRARTLRLIGLSRAAVRSTQAAEMAVTCLPATVGAALVYFVASRHLSRLPGTALGFYPADLSLPWWLFAIGVVAPSVVTCVVTAFTVEMEPSGRPPAPGQGARARRLGQATLLVGALMLVAAPILVRVVGFLAAASLWVGCALVACGLALSGPSIVVLSFRWVAERARAGGRLVGSRLAASSVSTSLRLGSLLGVLVVLLLGGGAFASVLNGGRQQDWQDRLAAQSRVPVVVTDLVGELDLPAMKRSEPDIVVAQQAETSTRGTSLTVVFADCSDLASLVGRPPQDCTGEPQWIDAAPRDAPHGRQLRLPNGHTRRLPATSDVTTVSGAPSSFTGSLLLPSRDAPTRPNANGAQYFALLEPTDLMPTLARIGSAAPAGQFDLGELDRHNPDTQQFPTQIQLLSVGAVTGLALGAVALLATAVGETRERSIRLRPLRLLGAPTRQLFYAHMWVTAAPLTLLGLVATALGWLTVAAMHNFDQRAAISTSVIAGTAMSTILASVVIGILTWPGVRHASPRSGAITG